MESACVVETVQKLTAAQQALVVEHHYLVDKVARPLRRRHPRHVHDEIPGLLRHALVVAAAIYEPATTDAPFAWFARRHIYRRVSQDLRKRSVGANDVVALPHDAAGEAAECVAPAGDVWADEMMGRVTGGSTREASRGPEAVLGDRQGRAHALAVLREERAVLGAFPRQLLELRYDRGLSWEAVGGCLGVSVKTIWRRHNKALLLLAPRLGARGVTIASLACESDAAAESAPLPGSCRASTTPPGAFPAAR